MDPSDRALVPTASRGEPLPPTTLMRLRFCEAYLETGNARESARRAGYQGNDRALDAVASRMLAGPDVQNYLVAHLRKIIPQEEARSILADIARSSIANFVKIDEHGQIAGFDFGSERAQANLHTIKSLKMGKNGPEIQLFDKMSALSLVLKGGGDDDAGKAQRRIAQAVLSFLPEKAREYVLRAIAEEQGAPEIEGERAESETPEAVKTERLLWLKELRESAARTVLEEDAAPDEGAESDE